MKTFIHNLSRQQVRCSVFSFARKSLLTTALMMCAATVLAIEPTDYFKVLKRTDASFLFDNMMNCHRLNEPGAIGVSSWYKPISVKDLRIFSNIRTTRNCLLRKALYMMSC